MQRNDLMKISFSTLACPDWSWSDIYSMAKDFGFDGIEIRGLGDEIFSVKAKPFTDSQLPDTIAKLKSLGLEIPCLSSGACLKFKDKFNIAEEEILAYAKLANKLGTSYIRILADLDPAPGGEVEAEEGTVAYGDGPVVAYVFKTIADPFLGKISLAKVIRGKLTPHYLDFSGGAG